MASFPYTDPRALAGDAYRDPAKLNARTAIYAHQHPQFDLVGDVVERLRLVNGAVLDVGCGPGRYARTLRAARPERPVVACDLSPGMIAAAGPQSPGLPGVSVGVRGPLA